MQVKINQPVLTQEEIELIHDKSLYLLENNGEIVESDEIVEVCKKSGFRVDGHRVYYPRKKVEEALKTAPKNFKMRGRYGNEAWPIRDGEAKLSPTLGPMNIYLDGKYRPSTMKDFVDFTILYETSDLVRTAAADIMRPRDMALTVVENAMLRLAVTLAYSTKPLRIFNEGGEIAEKSFNLIEKFYGADNMNDVYATTCISTASPFRLPRETCETFISFCKRGQQLMAQGSGMPGMTTPPTFAGTILQGNAEKLGIITLSQMMNPGNPVTYGLISMLSDLRYTSCITSSPASALRMMAERDMAEFYNLPSTATVGLADAKELDYQCGAEAFMMFLVGFYIRPDMAGQSLGVMDSYNALSFEKFIMDEENARIVKRLLQPMPIEEERLKIDRIMKVGPSGSYIGRTDKMYKEDFYMSDLYFTESSAEWLESGSPSLESKAREKYLKRLERYEPTELNAVQEDIVNTYVPKELRVR